MDRRDFIARSALGLAATRQAPAQGAEATPASTAADAAPAIVPVTIDTRVVTGPLPHVWEECAGSDRAAITLRESWRQDLARGRAEAGIRRIRFHGIFNDELDVYGQSIISRGYEQPNFQNVDQVYDGLLAQGVSPYVELSFMPKRLASGTRSFGFYGGNITPPTSNEAWAAFIGKFVAHLVDRYGLATVRAWPFEVWNEPNLPFFWSGTQQQYFELYKATAVAIKSVDASLQVGGPATAHAAWLPELADWCQANNAPIDFFATHAYAGDAQKEVFGTDEHYALSEVIPAAMRRVRAQIDAGAFRGRPLWLSEWSCDSPAMIAHIIAGCLPQVQAMSHWVLSGTYEELGVGDFVLKEGDNGFSMLVRGIAKPAFNTYVLLHALGTERLQSEGPVLAARAGSKVTALVWNLAEVEQPSGIPGQKRTRLVKGEARRMQLAFAGAHAGQLARVRYVDMQRGSPFPAWRAMGSPQYLKPEQTALLRQSAAIAPAETRRLDRDRRLTLELPAEGVALVELG
jgi:xylan 1,4-beta-xylosidase